jgi:hypothetical protein
MLQRQRSDALLKMLFTAPDGTEGGNPETGKKPAHERGINALSLSILAQAERISATAKR